LADFKVPKVIHVVKELPKGPTGKVQRRFMAGIFGLQP
jgi:acyl-coenzyme A synthetase/AMP-(fatty) acid ligase